MNIGEQAALYFMRRAEAGIRGLAGKNVRALVSRNPTMFVTGTAEIRESVTGPKIVIRTRSGAIVEPIGELTYAP
jgi:hypothetical protein